MFQIETLFYKFKFLNNHLTKILYKIRMEIKFKKKCILLIILK